VPHPLVRRILLLCFWHWRLQISAGRGFWPLHRSDSRPLPFVRGHSPRESAFTNGGPQKTFSRFHVYSFTVALEKSALCA
jgi:hypothetical protein